MSGATITTSPMQTGPVVSDGQLGMFPVRYSSGRHPSNCNERFLPITIKPYLKTAGNVRAESALACHGVARAGGADRVGIHVLMADRKNSMEYCVSGQHLRGISEHRIPGMLPRTRARCGTLGKNRLPPCNADHAVQPPEHSTQELLVTCTW